MKKKLSTADLIAYAFITEHCGIKTLASDIELNAFNELNCPACNEPIAFRSANGLWYVCGSRIFE